MSILSIDGELRFKTPITNVALGYLNSIFSDLSKYRGEIQDRMNFIDFELSDDFSGIKPNNGGEDPNDNIIDQVNWIIDVMKEQGFDVEFEGQILIEDEEGNWILAIGEDGRACRSELASGQKVQCPSCGHHFVFHFQYQS